MSKQDEAIRILREAFNIPAPRQQLPRGLAARALGEILAGVSGGAGISSLTADFPTRAAPAGTALHELQTYAAGRSSAQGSAPPANAANADGLVARKPTAELQSVIDERIARALDQLTALKAK